MAIDFDTAFQYGERFKITFDDGEVQTGCGLYSKSKRTLHFWADDTDCTKLTRKSKFSPYWRCVGTNFSKVKVEEDRDFIKLVEGVAN